MSNPFPSFGEEEPMSLLASLNLWQRYDARDWLLFADATLFCTLLLLALLIIGLEGIRMIRIATNAASPFNVYAGPALVPAAGRKKAE